MPKHKNISGTELWIPDVGKVADQETIETPEGFRNANFEAVPDEDKEISE